MDDTKQTLLSIDIDTAALIQNADKAKTSVKNLTDQLTALKAAGQGNTPIFSALSTQLKSSTTDLTNSTKALKDYTDALTKKTQAEQAETKAIQDNTTALQAQQKQGSSQTPTADKNAQKPPAEDPNEAAAKNRDLPYVDLVGGTRAAPIEPVTSKLNLDDQAASDGKASKPPLVQPPPKGFFQGLINDVSGFYTKIEKFDQDHLAKAVKIADERDKTYAKSVDIIGSLYDKTTAAGRAAIWAKKKLAIAEVAINTEQAVSGYITAIAKNVDADSGIPIVGPILVAADIASGAIQVAGAISNGVKQIQTLNSVPVDGKARGGIFQSDGMGAYLTGTGTGTSDSINARLSNGESVINARSTQMFGPILSAINQAGGGVPFHAAGSGGAYAQGGLFNGSNILNDGSTDLANTRAMNDMVKTIAANMPRQVLVVEDVQASLQNKVMLQNMSNF